MFCHLLGAAVQQPPVARPRGSEGGWAHPGTAEFSLAPALDGVSKKRVSGTCGEWKELKSQLSAGNNER